MGKGPLVQHLDYLIEIVEAEPDITMPELAVRLHAERGVTAAPASLSKLLCRAGQPQPWCSHMGAGAVAIARATAMLPRYCRREASPPCC